MARYGPVTVVSAMTCPYLDDPAVRAAVGEQVDHALVVADAEVGLTPTAIP